MCPLMPNVLEPRERFHTTTSELRIVPARDNRHLQQFTEKLFRSSESNNQQINQVDQCTKAFFTNLMKCRCNVFCFLNSRPQI